MTSTTNSLEDTLALQVEQTLKLKKEIKERRRKRNYHGSKLRKHFAEAKRLREEYNFSFADISLWLRQHKRTKMTPDGVRSAYNRINKELDLAIQE